MLKKLLSIVLVVSLVLSVIPFNVFAEAKNDGGTSENSNGNDSSSDNSNGNDSSSDNRGSSGNSSGNNSRFTVSFQTNGGNEISTISVSRGGTVSDLPTPQRMGFVFLGWYTDAAFTTQFTSGSNVTSNLTLYAKYAELQSVTNMEDERFALVDQETSLTFYINQIFS